MTTSFSAWAVQVLKYMIMSGRKSNIFALFGQSMCYVVQSLATLHSLSHNKGETSKTSDDTYSGKESCAKDK